MKHELKSSRRNSVQKNSLKSDFILRKYILEIPIRIKQELCEYASNFSHEVCGILIGKIISKNRYLITHSIIDKDAINPTQFSVTRNTKQLYPLVKEIVENSNDGNIDFIGDWHSHPLTNCEYSIIDYYAMQMMLNDPDYYFLEGIILAIVCPTAMFCANLFLRGKKKPYKMLITE